MADRNPEVMEMVGQELDRDPNISLDALFEKARAIDPAMGSLSMRQFHARYPLPIKRSRSPRKKSGKGGAKGTRRGATKGGASSGKSAQGRAGTPRDEVRKIFLDFAGALARAESRASIVDVLASVDQYVDRALQKAGKTGR